MKILRVISSIDQKNGGPMEGARKLDAELIKLGHKIEVVCLDEPDEGLQESYPVPVHTLGSSHFSYRYNARLLPWLKENHKNYDAVIVNGLWQYHSFAVWRALAGTSTPYFVFTHGMLDPWFKRTYPLKHLKKWLYWPWAEYRVLRDARAVLFTSEEECLQARESFWLYRCESQVTTYGTSDAPGNAEELAAKFIERYPHLRDKRIILFLSRIHEKKGCDLLVEAFANVARLDASLHLVMAGPDQTGWSATLQAKADQLGVGHRVSWPGMLQGDTKWGAFYAADVFCLPSHQENFGIVVAEALACGKPVLISNKINIWREIETDAAGYIAEDTAEGTIENLRRWLNMTVKEKPGMSDAAKQCFKKRFHVKNAASHLVNIMQGGSVHDYSRQ